MKKLFQNEVFMLGFSVGIVLIVLINFIAAVKSEEEFHHPPILLSAGGYEIGFPFTFYKVEVGYLNYFYFIWSGLLADLLVAAILSFIMGLIFKCVWSKVSARDMKLF